MNLQTVTHSPYTFLPSGILIVEPHEGLLTARTMLLAAAEYYVGVSDTKTSAAPRNQDDEYEVAVAILSESLGYSLLSATAQVVRGCWPHARILIVGRTEAAIEDNLYDARIDHKSRPEDLLAALVVLSEDPWNQRARPAKILRSGRTLPSMSGLYELAESDPTKLDANVVETISPRDVPASEQHFRRVS